MIVLSLPISLVSMEGGGLAFTPLFRYALRNACFPLCYPVISFGEDIRVKNVMISAIG